MPRERPKTEELEPCLCSPFFPQRRYEMGSLIILFFKMKMHSFFYKYAFNTDQKQQKLLKQNGSLFLSYWRRLKFDKPRLVWKLFCYHQGPRLLSFCCNFLSLWLPPHGPRWLPKLQPSHLHFSQQKGRWKGKGKSHWPELSYLATSSHRGEWEM